MGRKSILPRGANVFTVGAQLRQLRLDTGISLQEMADRLSYSKGYLSAIENGKERVHKELLRRYEEALQLEKGTLSGLLQMQYSTSISDAIDYLVKNASAWIPSLQIAFSPKQLVVFFQDMHDSEDMIVQEGRDKRRGFQQLSEKDSRRHLEFALRNAAEQGLMTLKTLEEREHYRNLLAILSEPSFLSEELRLAAIRQFIQGEELQLDTLNAMCARLLTIHLLAQSPVEVDMKPYLISFFRTFLALIAVNPIFRPIVAKSLRTHPAVSPYSNPIDVVAILQQIYNTLPNSYTPEQFAHDLSAYTRHIEKNLHYLKLVGIVPKDRNNSDPELNGTFVPLRVALQHQTSDDAIDNSLVGLLELNPYMVLLGGPGSGKSTSARHLAWSHSLAANSSSFSDENIPVLSGKPVPLRIELRRLSEERRRSPEHDLLSYVIEVLLEREDGVKINRQMFEILLERGAMLLIFDGLDEVATLDERKQLVEEIEDFILNYPGNRVLVTSRPVGYGLAPCSYEMFAHAQVQNFNDEQIHCFLQNWYTYVLKLPNLSRNDQEEFEELFNTLINNQRLHKLAENPLLLTVITALHRYERLPDKRVLVYDRCANLLLDTWARLRGTDIRWKDLRMSKDEQFACVAHLGHVLHTRSQEEHEFGTSTAKNEYTPEEGINDVPATFLLEEIERFLSKRRLSIDEDDQHTEARRFRDLMLEEAGLIVERGTGEDGEPLYGFIHRTFQEYFAAAYVFDQFKQEVSLSVIEKFLKEYLHDPHWHEVILLLLGNLSPKPVTNLFRDLLNGTIKSRRSKYNSIVQQDLFFVSSCLIEEIVVQQDLTERVISDLADLVLFSPFKAQGIEALERLGLLLKTRQYGSLANRALLAIAEKKDVLETETGLRLVILLENNSSPQEQHVIAQLLECLVQRLDFSRSLQGTNVLEETDTLKGRSQIIKFQERLLNCRELSLEHALIIAEQLFSLSSNETKEKQRAAQLLIQLAQHKDLSIENCWKSMIYLYSKSLNGSEEKRQAAQLLEQFAQHPDLQPENAIMAIGKLYSDSLDISEEWQDYLHLLKILAQRPGLSVEQIIQLAGHLPRINSYVRSTALIQKVSSDSFDWKPDTIVLHSELPFESSVYSTLNLYRDELSDNLLTYYSQRSDLSIEQLIQTIQISYQGLTKPTEERKLFQLVKYFVQRPDITVEQAIRVIQSLCRIRRPSFEVYSIIAQMLSQFTRYTGLLVEQVIQIGEILTSIEPRILHRRFEEPEKSAFISLFEDIAQRDDLSAEQIIRVAFLLIVVNAEGKLPRQMLLDIAQDQVLSIELRLKAISGIFRISNPWPITAQIIRIVLSLLGRQEAKEFFAHQVQSNLIARNGTQFDIPALVELAQQDLLPAWLRNRAYLILYGLIPKFSMIMSDLSQGLESR